MSTVEAHPPQRHVLVGVSGGIAIYKAVELVRLLAKEGFGPAVVATEASKRFIMPLTFAAVARAAVLDDESSWQPSGGWFEHIDAARRADVMVVAPATANTVAKLATGLADNLLSAIYLAFRGPVIVAPTANWAMYEHEATRRNLEILAARGVEVLPTGVGDLACGEEGAGRMASPDTIMAAVRRAFAGLAAGPLAGRKVVVTAGGTREAIDAVRYIGNRSSGKMGRAAADEAYLRGADVVLVTTQRRRRDAVPVRRGRERRRDGRRRRRRMRRRGRTRHGGRRGRLPSGVGRRGQALAQRLAGACPVARAHGRRPVPDRPPGARPRGVRRRGGTPHRQSEGQEGGKEASTCWSSTTSSRPASASAPTRTRSPSSRPIARCTCRAPPRRPAPAPSSTRSRWSLPAGDTVAAARLTGQDRSRRPSAAGTTTRRSAP